MIDPKKKRGFGATLIMVTTPAGAVKRIFTSLSRTKEALSETARGMREALPGQVRGDYPEGDVRNITDAKERFEAMYQLHGWSEPELAVQVRTLKFTKITAIVMAIFSVAGVVWLAVVAPLWLSIFLIPMGGCSLVLGLAQAFKYALYEAQIQLREFISAKEFINRDDFWPRVLG